MLPRRGSRRSPGLRSAVGGGGAAQAYPSASPLETPRESSTPRADSSADRRPAWPNEDSAGQYAIAATRKKTRSKHKYFSIH